MTRVSDFAEHLRGFAIREADGVREEVGTIDHEGRRLLFVLVRPQGGTRRTGLVIAHSFLEMAMLQKTELSLARRAAASGYPVIYLQAPGAGDSEGEEAALTIEARVESVLAASSFLDTWVDALESFCFFGVRLGAAVATMAAQRAERAGGLVVWDPIFDAGRYWKQARRLARIIAVVGRQRGFEDPEKELARNGWASMFGNTITEDLRTDLRACSAALDGARLEVPTLVLSLNDEMVAGSLTEMASVTVDPDTYSLNRPDVGHLGLRDAPEAVEPTVEWMARRLG
ncbi:MAG TPA: hypothetical protein VFS18_04265 [Actinomycetota bacterium]|nr:hypothetical protein [Actinomycetota bacterium]